MQPCEKRAILEVKINNMKTGKEGKMKRFSMVVCFLSISAILATSCFADSETITAWGTVQIEGFALGMNNCRACVELSCAPQPVQHNVWHQFEFKDLPCDTRGELVIKIPNPSTEEPVTYHAAYTFRSPERQDEIKSGKIAGYLGDFLYNPVDNTIRRESRY
jgi:hypothetical protein